MPTKGRDILLEISKQVEKNTKIKTYPKVVEDILAAIKKTTDFWQIVRFSQRTIPVVAETIKLLEKEKILSIEDNEIRISQKDLEGRIDKILPYLSDLVCPECNGRGLNIKVIGIYDEFCDIRKQAPKPIQEYDQGNITAESTVARVAFMRLRGDIGGKRIIVLGDDDLVGIALGLTRMPEEVLVLDIDKRIIDFTNHVAKEKKIPVRAEVFDLCEPLPKNLKGRFDVVTTDPPETKRLFMTFIQKGIWALKGEGRAGYIGMTLIDSSTSKWADIQKMILQCGGVITDIIRDFNKYEIWDYHQKTVAWKLAPTKSLPTDIWYTSAMVRFEITHKKSVENKRISLKNRRIYVDNESTTT